MVVDAEASVRNYVRTILLRHGFHVLEAADGLSAFHLIRRSASGVRLVLADIETRRVDGIALGRKVSAEYPDIKVVYTARRSITDHVPVNRFLAKPFTPDALIRCVFQLCTPR